MMRILDQLLPYNFRLPVRPVETLNAVVVHCTELPTLEMAREYGERVLYDDGTGNTGHYYIDRDGSIYRYVADDRIARHVVGHNQNSIGIELVNTGRYPNWFSAANQHPTEPYPDEQIQSLKGLLRFLKEKYPQLHLLARHSDLDMGMITAEDDPALQVRRKIDPGPQFPWEDLQHFWNGL